MKKLPKASEFVSTEGRYKTGAEVPTCDETAVFYASVLHAAILFNYFYLIFRLYFFESYIFTSSNNF
jgi:hypothetical protein